MEMPRVLVFDHLDNQVCELSPNDVFSLVRTEEINGQNSLEITSSQPLSKEQRVLVRDMMGNWREYVVTGVDESHLSGEHATGTYFCEWSLKHDLMGVTVIDKRPGVQTPVLAGVALGDLLSYTRRWAVGDVTVTATGGQSLYWISAWEGLSKIVNEWGGEAKAEIAVSPSGVISRKLSLLETMGEQAAKRRFDFGYDLTGIQRKVEETPVYCRVYPRGKGEETGSGGYGRRITIESANNGVAYIENEDTAQVVRLPDGQGGYEYPSCVIENSEIDDPAALKEWAESVSDDYTTPRVTYTGTVEQFAAAGLDAKGVSLGDAVQCVDREFAPNAALRVNGRIVKIVVDERDPFGANLTIGYVSGGLASLFGDLGKTVRNTANAVEAMNGGTMSTADYLERLIDRINAEINATGGYTYIKPGEGIWVYDKAEDQDPSQVVRIMGGSISIANDKTAQGEWDWETMMTGRDGILASAITAAHITSGWIGSADAEGKWTGSGNYINFDTGEIHLAATATVGGKEIATADTAITEVDVEYRLSDSATSLTGGYQWSTTAPEWVNGKYMWQRTKTVTASDVSYSDATCIAGATGATGSPGSQGETGVGVSAVVEQYYLSTSSVTRSGGSWSTAQPAWASGKYIWTRSAVTWTTGETTYTDPVLAKAINGANESVKSLDDSLNQQGVFNRLTNNGQAQGIYLSGGKLYINGTYIASGTIDAKYVYAGILRDKKGRNSWDLTNGTLTTSYMTANYINASGTFECGSTYKTKLQSGTMYGYQSGTQVGYIDFTASSRDLTNNQIRKGIQIQANGIVRITSPRMATAATSNVGTTATFGFTGWVKLNNVVFNMNSNMTSCSWGDVQLKFINGLFVGLGSHTTGLTSYSGG